jgi:hypothetical protein
LRAGDAFLVLVKVVFDVANNFLSLLIFFAGATFYSVLGAASAFAYLGIA